MQPTPGMVHNLSRAVSSHEAVPSQIIPFIESKRIFDGSLLEGSAFELSQQYLHNRADRAENIIERERVHLFKSQMRS